MILIVLICCYGYFYYFRYILLCVKIVFYDNVFVYEFNNVFFCLKCKDCVIGWYFEVCCYRNCGWGYGVGVGYYFGYCVVFVC